MRDTGILSQKGKGRATYYVPDLVFNNPELGPNALPFDLNAPVSGLSTLVPALSKPVTGLPDYPGALPNYLGALSDQLPAGLIEMLKDLGKRTSDKEKMNAVILSLCAWKALTMKQLAALVQRNEKYMLGFVTQLRESGQLVYTIPDMPNHPEQAYQTPNSDN
jgi:ATP-dependent DNA helicase RecG